MPLADDSEVMGSLLAVTLMAGLLAAGLVILGRIVREHDNKLDALRETMRMHVHEQQIGVTGD